MIDRANKIICKNYAYLLLSNASCIFTYIVIKNQILVVFYLYKNIMVLLVCVLCTRPLVEIMTNQPNSSRVSAIVKQCKRSNRFPPHAATCQLRNQGNRFRLLSTISPRHIACSYEIAQKLYVYTPLIYVVIVYFKRNRKRPESV